MWHECNAVALWFSGKKDRKSARADDYTDDDMMSTTSTVSSSDFGGAPETEETGFDESTLMDQYVEALYQKRYGIACESCVVGVRRDERRTGSFVFVFLGFAGN